MSCWVVAMTRECRGCDVPMSVVLQPSSSASIDSSSAWWLPVMSPAATAGVLPLLGAGVGLGACRETAKVIETHITAAL